MFRFLHAADCHIDSPLIGLDAYDGAPVAALRGATRMAFENLVALALAERVDFVLLAGDVFDGDRKDYATGLFFVRQMARLKAAGITVYSIAGNHDAASTVSRRLTLPDNVHVFSTRSAETVLPDNLPLALHGRGFPHRAAAVWSRWATISTLPRSNSAPSMSCAGRAWNWRWRRRRTSPPWSARSAMP